MSVSLTDQFLQLGLLTLPVASIAWTITHEEVFREPRRFCESRSRDCRTILARKFFYLFTCEYCFSHYVGLAVLAVTGFRLVYDDWRGAVVAFFGLVWTANVYMNLYARLRVELREQKAEATVKEKVAEKLDDPRADGDAARLAEALVNRE